MADGLNLELIDKFNKKLDEAYDKLIKLDAQLEQFNKDISLDIKAGAGLKTVSRALDDLARAVSRFSGLTKQDVTKSVKNLVNFVKQIESVAQIAEKINVSGITVLVTSITDTIKTINSAAAGFKVTNETNISSFVGQVLIPVFRAINTLLVEVKGLTPSRINSLSDNYRAIGAFFKIIADVANQVQALPESALDPKLFKTLKPFIEAVLVLLQRIETITPERLRQAASAFSAVGDLFAQIGVAIESLAPAKSASLFSQFFKLDPLSKFVQLTAVVRSLFFLAQELNPARLSGLAEAFNGLETLFRGLGGIIRVIEDLGGKFKLPTSLFRNLLVFQRIVDPLIRIAKEIAEISPDGGAGETFSGFYQLIRGLARAVGLIESLQGKFTGFTNLFRQLQILDRVAGRLVNITKAFADATRGVDPAAFEGVERIVKGLQRGIKLLLGLETQFAGAKFGFLDVGTGRFIRSADLLERAGGRLANIIKKVGSVNIPPNALQGLSRFIPTFVSFFRELVLIDIDNNAYKGVNKALKQMDEVSKLLRNILKNLGGGIGGASAKDLGDSLRVVKQLGDFSSTFQGSSRGFLDFIRNLGGAINDISVDATALQSLKELAEILGNLKNIDELRALSKAVGPELKTSVTASVGVFRRFREALVSAVTEGILRANLLIKVFGALQFAALELAKVYLRFVFPPAVVASNITALQNIGNALREIGDQVRDTGQQLADFGRQFIADFGLGALFNTAAVQSAVGFDQILDQIQIFGNLSADATAQAEELAFLIGQKYPLSANDAAAAILDLTKAGQSLSSIEFVLPAAADLAALSDTGDLNTVIETLIAAEGSFDNFADGVEGTFDNIAIATDILAAGANVSTASVESLAQGLGNVGTAANAFGLSLDETTAILAIFNDAGIQSAEGGTALRSLLAALERPQTATALNRLGVSLFDPETGGKRPLNDIINDINVALSDLPSEQRTAVINSLADTFGRQGLNILLAQGADGINNVVAEMNALPDAGTQAQQMLDNLSGDMLQLGGSVETFLLRAALPLVERFFRPIVKVGRLVVDTLLSLDQGFFDFLGTMVAILATGATLVGGFSILVGVLLQVGGTVLSVVGFFLNFQLVLGTIIAGTAALVTGILAISAAFLVFAPLVLGITAIVETLFAVFENNTGGAATAAQAFLGTLGSTFNTVAAFVQSVLNILNVLVFTSDNAQDNFQTFGETIAGIFGGLSAIFTSGFIGNLRVALGQFTQIFDAFANIANLQSQISNTTELLQSLFSANRGRNIEGYSLQIDEYSNQIEALRESVRTTVASLVTNVPLFRNAVQAMFGNTTTESITAFVEIIFGAFDQISGGFNRIIQAFAFFVQSLNNGVGLGTALQNLRVDLSEGITEALLGFVTIFESFFGENKITDLIQSAAEGGLTNIGRVLIEFLIQSIRDGIVQNRDALRETFLSVVDAFFGLLRNLRFITDLLGAGPISDLFERFESVLRGLLGGVFDTIINLIAGQDLRTALQNAFGDSIDFLFSIADSLSRIFSVIQRAILGFLGFFAASGRQLETSVSGFNFGEALAGFVGAIRDFVNLASIGDFGKIGAKILEGLLSVFTGLGSLALSGLINVGQFILDLLGNLGESFIDYLQNVGVPSEFIDFGLSLLDSIGEGIKSAFSTVSSAVFDFPSFIASLGTNLNEEAESSTSNPFLDFGTWVVDQISAAINDAFNFLKAATGIDLATAFDRIGDALSDLYTTFIETFFGTQEEGDTTFFENFTGTLSSLATTITTVYNAVRGSGGASKLGAFVNAIIQFISGIISFGITTVERIIVFIDALFFALGQASPQQLLGLAAAIGVISAALIFFNRQLIATFLTNQYNLLISRISTFSSAFYAAIRPALGILAAILIFNALAESFTFLTQAFEALLQGDIVGFFGKLGTALLTFAASIAEQLDILTGGALTGLINALLSLFGQDAITLDIKSVVLLGETLANMFGEILKNIDVFQPLESFFDTITSIDSSSLIAAGIALGIFFGPLLLAAASTALSSTLLAISTFVTSLGAAGVGVGIASLATGGFAALGTFFTVTLPAALSTAGTAILGFAQTILIPAAGFLSLFLIIRSVINNFEQFGDVIEELASGDILGVLTELADALGRTFIDIGLPVVNSLLDLFGIDEDLTNEQIRQLAVNLFNTVISAVRLAGLSLQRLLAQVAADASIGARRASNIFGTDTELALAEQFFDTNKDFSLQAIRDLENNLSAQGLTLRNSITADFAVTNQDEVAAGITNSIRQAIAAGDPVPLTPEDIITFQNLEILPRLVQDAIFQEDFGLLNALLQGSAEAPLDLATIDSLVNNIRFGVETGLLTAAEAEALLVPLRVEVGETTVEGVTPEQVNAIIEAAQLAIAPAPIPIDIPVDVTLGGGSSESRGKNGEEQDARKRGGGGEEKTSSSGESPLSQLGTDIENLLPALESLGIFLASSQVAFDASVIAATNYSLQLAGINLGLQTMILNLSLVSVNLLGLGIGFVGFGTTAGAVLGSLNSGFSIFRNQLLVMLQTMIQGFILVEAAANRLETTLGNVVARAQNIATTVNDTVAAAESAGNSGAGAGSGSQVPVDGERAQGGSTQADSRYRVAEGGPEVYFENGKMFLLTKDAGRVVPLGSNIPMPRNDMSTGLYPTPSRGAGGASSSVTNNVTVEGATISVTIDGASGDASAIAEEAVRKIKAELKTQSETVSQILRRNHR